MRKSLPAIRDGISFIATLNAAKLINVLCIHFSYVASILLRRPKHCGMPTAISIEPTTSCNLRCPECPAGLRKFSRPTGMMPADIFKNAIDQLKAKLIWLMLYFQGEPYLNPAFFEMVQYAAKEKVYTATSTNAHFLTDENARKTVESGLHRLIISIDGTTQETYQQYRIGGKLDQVTEGVANIVKWKKQLASATPYVIVQFLVLKSNQHQITEIKALAGKLGVDRLDLKTAQVYNYANDNDRIPDDPKYARYVKTAEGRWKLKKPLKNHCFRMWSGAVITWDGTIVPCCFDKDAAHKLGSLERSNFGEIWNSEAYRNFRKQILNDRSKIEICRNCTE